MASTQKAQVVITANAATAKKIIQELDNRIAALKQRMMGLDTSTKSGQKEFKKLKQELMSYNSAQVQNIKNTDRIKAAMNNLSGTSLKDLKRALAAAKSEMNKMSASDKGLQQMRFNAKMLQQQIDKLSGSVKKSAGAWSTAWRNITMYMGAMQMMSMAIQKVRKVFSDNFKFGDELNDIRKVSGLASSEVDQLATKLAKIDTRTGISELNKLAYAGSKLGMGKYGVDGLNRFVAAANQVNVALKEDLGEEALTSLSKMVETMGLLDNMDIQKAMLKTGSAMFQLSTTSTATSANIVEFAKRLTGMARTAGITTDQLLALGSASDSMMLMPEVASTAFSKLIASLQKNPRAIEAALKIPKGTLNTLFEGGNAMQAIVEILEAMKKKGNMNALDDVFKDLGSDGARLISVMVTMSKNVDTLKSHIQTSKEAFEEGSAVTKEYKMQQESALGIMQRANNMWEKAFVNTEGVDMVKRLAQAWYDMSNSLTHSEGYIGSMKLAFEALAGAVKILVMLLPVLINFFVARGIIEGVSLMLSMGSAIRAVVVALKAATTAQLALNSAMTKNVWGAIAAVIITAVTALISYVTAETEAEKKAKELAKAQEELKAAFHDTKGKIDAQQYSLQKYKEELNKTNLKEEERNGLLAKFRQEFGSYISALGIEINTVEDLNRAYNDLNTAIEQRNYLTLYKQRKQKIQESHVDDMGAALENLDKVLNSFKTTGIVPGWVDAKYVNNYFKSGGGNSADVYKYIVEHMPGMTGAKDIKIDYKTGNYSYTTKGGNRNGVKMNSQLLNALTWAYNANKRYTADVDANNKRFTEVMGVDPEKIIAEDAKRAEEANKPGSINGETAKERKAREREAAKLAREQKKEWRDDLKAEEKEATAIMDKIKNYYERQKTEIIKKATELGMDEEVQKSFIDNMTKRENTALASVRKVLSGNKSDWDNFNKTMLADMLEPLGKDGKNESTKLLEGIQKNNVAKLYDQIQKLSKNLKLPTTALIDQVWKNASLNEQGNAKIENNRMQNRRKAALDRDYTATATNASVNGLFKEGFFDVGYDTYSADIKAVTDMLTRSRDKIVEIMASNGDKDALLKILGIDTSLDVFAPLVNMSIEDAKLFWKELMEDYDRFTEAQKKGDDERKKVNDYGWSQTDYYKQYNADMPGMEGKAALMGSYRSIGQSMGFADVATNDPELEMLKARMEFAQKYYDYIEQHNATETQLAEARKSIMQAQTNYAKRMSADIMEQYQAVMGFASPLQTFTESVSDAFLTMRDDASAGRKAIVNAVKAMIKSFAQQSLQMIMKNEQERANLAVHLATMQMMRQTFNQAELQGEAAQGIALAATKSQNNTTLINLDALYEQQRAALKSAGIFGWCVSELGPVAGPIAYSAMMATLMGLLNYAIGLIGGSSSSSSESASVNTKLVSGMLTYDEGNVGQFVGTDGRVYTARDAGSLPQGVSMVTSPIATTVNGQPSLVGELGPEIVIGRRTTAAIMQNAPYLLSMLAQYDKNRSVQPMRLFDDGNVSNLSPALPNREGDGTQQSDPEMKALMVAMLGYLKNPVAPNINMYGDDGLHAKMQRANQFMARH